MDHPKDIGDRTTLAVMLALRNGGFTVSVPFGENTRYDLVVDDGLRLGRVQCKSGQLVSGVVRFKTASTYAHHKSATRLRRDYKGEIEFFGVYCHANDRVYLVPIADVAATCEARLRVDPPRNGQMRRIRYASAYEIGVVRVRPATRAPRESSGARGSFA